MNCQEANHLLDGDPQRLSPAQSESIHRHVAGCHACGEEWADWQAMLLLPVPATPASLWPRIIAALPVRREPRRRAWRPLVIGGVLLGGAALAGAWVEWVRHASAPVATALVAGSAAPSRPNADADSAVDAPVHMPASEPAAETSAADSPSAKALDPQRVLVLKRPEAAADARALALADQCHDAIVRELRSLRGVSVVLDAGASTRQSGQLLTLPDGDREIAREHGAGKVVSISTVGGCEALLHDAASGAMMAGVTAPGLDGGKVPVEALARAISRNFGDKVLLDPDSELAQARANVLDTSLDDAERLNALLAPLRRLTPPYRDTGFFDAQVIAAAIRLGTNAADPGIRASVWSSLQRVKDPLLVKPLLQVLARDTHAQVRSQAALDLNNFLDEPGVREALRRAASEDPSSTPDAVCCVLTVREAAQRSLVADKDYGKWVLDTLLDERLPVRSRLISLQDSSPDGRFRMFSIRDLGNEAARVVFDIGQGERDAGLRRMAWTALKHARPDDAFEPVLVEDLASHADEFVRAAAATALAGYVDRSTVRAAFERALNDPSIAVRRAAGEALAGK